VASLIRPMAALCPILLLAASPIDPENSPSLTSSAASTEWLHDLTIIRGTGAVCT